MSRCFTSFRRDRDESGAIAVMVALMSVVILAMAAVAVDMGQVYAKRASLQSAVDHAALAAAVKMDGSNTCTPGAVSAAKDYLLSNWIDQGGDPETLGSIKLNNSTESDGTYNGRIVCRGWRVDLWAPTAKVDLGLAKAVIPDAEEGARDKTAFNVPAHAAVAIKSPQFGTLPMYIAASCISGSAIQLTDPPRGQISSLTPPDFPDSPLAGPFNSLKFSNSWTDVNFSDDEIAAGNTSIKVQLQGPKYAAGDVITFTPNDNLATTYSQVLSAADVNSNSTTFNLPSAVSSYPGIWWVRVKRTLPTVSYMRDSEARAITIGDIKSCNGSLSGNFGTLNLARTVRSQELIKNIILGAEPSLTLNASSAVPCPVAQSETVPTSPTDCVSTKPGFPGSELTSGLILGVPPGTTLKGRLNAPTTPGCSRNRTSSLTPGTFSLNDDQLACFLVNGATLAGVKLGGTAVAGLSGTIVTSPRFFRIPVLPEDPSRGTSTNYPITRFYYVFISAEGVSGNPGLANYNGIEMNNRDTKIKSLSVVILNDASLPSTVPNPGNVTDYSGSGPKVAVLVD